MTKQWKTQRTLLIIGEGEHEVAFLQHVHSLYVTRNSGLSVKISNAQGGGAKSVLAAAIAKSRNAAYDLTAVLLDTDTGFTESVINRAKSEDIRLLLSEPCLEAMLLRLLGEKVKNGTTNKELKKQLSFYVGEHPEDKNSYKKHFPREVFNHGRKKEKTIDDLLSLLNAPF